MKHGSTYNMVSIKEFLNQIRNLRESQKSAECLDLNDLFEHAGYVSVKFTTVNMACLDWCGEKFGLDHCAWTGSKFWFESEKDAIMFTLRWGRDN
jgi:hypothetical protein